MNYDVPGKESTKTDRGYLVGDITMVRYNMVSLLMYEFLNLWSNHLFRQIPKHYREQMCSALNRSEKTQLEYFFVENIPTDVPRVT
jgi:hypothetical protein